METVKEGERKLYFDILRIIACFSVVMLHSASQTWYAMPVTSRGWQIANSYDALFRFGVPVFVMISGALFLNPQKKITIKKLYTHNILRLFVLFVFWSCFYGIADCIGYGDVANLTLQDVVRDMVLGRYHLWFLPMIIGIYVMLPVLKIWIENAPKRNLEYFLIVFLVLQIIRETIRAVFPYNLVNYVVDYAAVELASSYAGYFVLGYYLVHVGIEKKWYRYIYAGAGIGAVLNVIFGNLLAVKAGEPTGAIYDSFGIFTLLVSVALLLFVKEKTEKIRFSPGAEKWIKELSSATLGIYVMHVGMIELLERHGIEAGILPLILGIPFLAAGTFAACFLIAAILRRIPVIGKYLC